MNFPHRKFAIGFAIVEFPHAEVCHCKSVELDAHFAFREWHISREARRSWASCGVAGATCCVTSLVGRWRAKSGTTYGMCV